MSLGSALGNSVVWPAAAFGFTGKGYDVLESAVGMEANILVIVTHSGNILGIITHSFSQHFVKVLFESELEKEDINPPFIFFHSVIFSFFVIFYQGAV